MNDKIPPVKTGPRCNRQDSGDTAPPNQPGVPETEPSRDEFLCSSEVGSWLRISESKMRRHRREGTGPVFHSDKGRIRYRKADVEAWLKPLRRTSTRDTGNCGDTAD